VASIFDYKKQTRLKYMYTLFKLASIVIPRLPRWFVLSLANLIGLVAWLVASKARKRATANMIHVLGPQVLATRADRRRLRRCVRGIFQNSARNYLEVFFLPYTRPESFLRNIDAEGIEHLEAALALGKGVILFSAHLGPFEFLVQWLSLKGYQVTIPTEQLKDQRMLDLMLKLRSSRGIHFIPLGDGTALRSVIQALRNNQIVLIAADRAVQGESVEKPFFGEPARLPIGPVSLSQRTGAALLGAFGWRTSSKRIAGQVVPLSLELTEEERANTDKLLCAVIEMMEQFIKAHPDQWLVFSPVWKDDHPISYS
jgi:lauroyl/myristoyl acyltransferase